MEHVTTLSEDSLSGRSTGRGATFFTSLALIGFVALLAAPRLAESELSLISGENVDAALELAHDREEILWFARAIYSESEFTEEQYYIAWAIRNRVGSPNYPDTYEEVVLQPHQFSGLNPYDQWYEVNISRDYGVGDAVWESALAVAREVYHAPEDERLLPSDALHFYSPVAVATPGWAMGRAPVETLHGRRGIRFAFYAGVE